MAKPISSEALPYIIKVDYVNEGDADHQSNGSVEDESQPSTSKRRNANEIANEIVETQNVYVNPTFRDNWATMKFGQRKVNKHFEYVGHAITDNPSNKILVLSCNYCGNIRRGPNCYNFQRHILRQHPLIELDAIEGTPIVTKKKVKVVRTPKRAIKSNLLPARIKVMNSISINKPDSSNLMIIDSDCGLDDALAILLGLASDWHIMAFTSCRGNTSAINAANNIMRLLELCKKQEIPVYVGCEKPLVHNDRFETSFHGVDGFGGIAHEMLTGSQKVQPEPAALALVQYAEKMKGQISLVALGPLTNLAIAQRLDPKFGSNLKELVIMGGNIDGVGNTLPASEFNFFIDPEAAEIVLSEFKCAIKIYPWETCLRSLLPWEWFDEWVAQPTVIGEFVERLTRATAAQNRVSIYPEGFHVPDLQAMAILVYPDLIIQESIFPVAVELQGKHTRGMLVVDRRSDNHEDKKSKLNISLVTAIDVERLKTILMDLTSLELS